MNVESAESINIKSLCSCTRSLPEGTRPELETHLRECADCQDAYESEKAMHAVVRGRYGAVGTFHRICSLNRAKG